mgnify:CR=1 FL=1
MYAAFPISMPAKNMYDEITAQFYDANDTAVGDAVTFDLVTYMDKVKTYDYASIISTLKADEYDVLSDMNGNYVGATMLLKSTPILRPYYKEAVDGLDLGDNKKWDTNKMNSNLTFIQKEISATNFDTKFNGYSVYHYFCKVFESDDGKLMKLCASLYDFSKAANAISK